MYRTVTLYLIGLAGAGKYTVSKEFANSGYKIVDNQLTNKPIVSLLDQDGVSPIPENAWEAIEIIRTAILDFVSQDKKSDYVLTKKLCGVEQNILIYNQVQKAAEKRGSLFIPVKLILSQGERKKRIKSPERRIRFKTTVFDDCNSTKTFLKIEHPNLLEINVTNFRPKQVKQVILKFIKSKLDV